ncbi:MAG: nicotinamide-nucleotide adenylyltransferase [Candidatus Aenigmarchaeota archaeon]|nr:nicotinamide-nucleotide adenylyltransferase [Candidatus Aenigmarchaeota archaeon]
MVYCIFRICSSKGAWELKPKNDLKLDLFEVAKRFEKVDFKTKVLLSVEAYGSKVSIYPTGKVLVFDVKSETKGRMIATKVFKAIAGECEREEKVALFVGRFQPFHIGHLKVVRDIIKKYDRLTVVIGGPAEDEPTVKDPFTFREREEMIIPVLKSTGKDYELHILKDVNDDKKWIESISKIGNYDAAYTRNPWTAKCLKLAKIPVKRQKMYERYKHCGRIIRKRILEGRDWSDLVPKEVYSYVKGIRGEERIKILGS